MKKLLGLLVIAAMFTFVACGPSAEEIEKKRVADSIHVTDSIAKEQQKADSIAKAQAAIKMEQQRQDSIAKAEAEKANKGKGKGKKK